MGTVMDIPVTTTDTAMEIPGAVTATMDTMGKTEVRDASIIAGLAAIARRVISAGQSVSTIARR
jgi:hypothetical protein